MKTKIKAKIKTKIYKIPVLWQSWGLVEVEASSLEDAIEQSVDGNLPDNSEYIEDSFQVDMEGIEIHNELTRKEKGKLQLESF